MPRRFSTRHRTFEEWLAAHSTRSPYVERVLRGRALHPTATLSQLRRHPLLGQGRLSALPRAPPFRIPPDLLSPRELETRARALEALTLSRRERFSLAKASRMARTTPETTRRYTGAFRMVQGRYRPTNWDRLERWMQVYEEGRLRTVRVADSETASLLGRYSNAVKAYLETRDPGVLDPYRGITFRDAEGRVHELETNERRLVAAAERSERDYGQFEIYAEMEEVLG